MIGSGSRKSSKPRHILDSHVQRQTRRIILAALCVGLLLGPLGGGSRAAAQIATFSPQAVKPLPGMPPVMDPTDLYSETVAGRFSPAVAGALSRIIPASRLC